VKNLSENDAFRADNTEGYTQDQIDAFNAELDARLEGIEAGTDEYYRVVKAFDDEIASR
jgi:hypothetical protein